VLQTLACGCELAHLLVYASDGKGFRWRHGRLPLDFMRCTWTFFFSLLLLGLVFIDSPIPTMFVAFFEAILTKRPPLPFLVHPALKHRLNHLVIIPLFLHWFPLGFFWLGAFFFIFSATRFRT
jgi:hypothetical protein